MIAISQDADMYIVKPVYNKQSTDTTDALFVIKSSSSLKTMYLKTIILIL